MAELLGGSLKKKSMNTIPFNAEMRTLAYVMIHNLYPVTNLTTLFRPRTIFIYDLYTHKEIDICGHIPPPNQKCHQKEFKDNHAIP